MINLFILQTFNLQPSTFSLLQQHVHAHLTLIWFGHFQPVVFIYHIFTHPDGFYTTSLQVSDLFDQHYLAKAIDQPESVITRRLIYHLNIYFTNNNRVRVNLNIRSAPCYNNFYYVAVLNFAGYTGTADPVIINSGICIY